MKKTDAWMPLYIGDYLADTARLTTEQHGAYLLLLMDYWRNGPPPDDDGVLAAIAKLDSPKWRKHSATLRAFFRVENGRLLQGRAEIERAKANGISGNRSSAGKAGANARWSNGNGDASPIANPIANQIANPIANGMANASQTDAPSPKPKPREKEKPPKPPLPDGRFPEFWQAWPKSPRKGGRPEALRVWASRNLDAEATAIVAHVRSMAATEGWTKQGGEYIPAPVVYLRGRRWDGAELFTGRDDAPRDVDWRETRSGVLSHAYALGFGPYEELDHITGRAQSWASYRSRVIASHDAKEKDHDRQHAA